ASQNVRQTHALEVGDLTQSVTVESSAPLVNTVSAEQRESLDALKVKELPLSRRNVTNVLRLSSGVDTSQGSVRINGQGKSGAGVTVDGTDANANPSEGRAMAQYGERNYIDVMSIEAVQEVQLMRGILQAEFGGVISGQVNLISKSGSNQWHGSLFENNRAQSVRGEPPERWLDDPKEPGGLQPVRRVFGRPRAARQGILLLHLRRLSRIRLSARDRHSADPEIEKHDSASSAISRDQDFDGHLAATDPADYQGGWRRG